MSVHEPQPCRQCRSVSFDDGKRRAIATDLDPEVEPLTLKTSVGRPPTPRPRLTDAAPLRRPAASSTSWAMAARDPPAQPRRLLHNVRGGAPTGPPVPVGVLRRWQAACHRHRPGPRGGAAHAEDFRGQAPNTPAAANRRNTSSSPNGQCDELGDGCSRHPSAASEVGVAAAASSLLMEMEVCTGGCYINWRMSLIICAL
ncbi:hypothetical protein V5799_030389 [Amblyomma americanum]|uniref:Uncharacterized protein n=1 Tax=Amblyomma americanum TaxID=6943 RepID=A0AAQ4END3_AMBAM